MPIMSTVVKRAFLNFTIAMAAMACASKSGDSDIGHFKAAIEFSNRAAALSNKNQPFEDIDSLSMVEVMQLHQQALIEAKQVSIEKLNKRLEGFGDHFADEFVKGKEAYLAGYKTNDPEEFLRGQLLLEDWSNWYGSNADRLRGGQRMHWEALIACCVACMGGLIMFKYHRRAHIVGLPVGEFFESGGVMRLMGGVIALVGFALSITLNPWWSTIVVLCAADWSSGPLIKVFRVKAQLVGFLLAVGGLVWSLFVWF